MSNCPRCQGKVLPNALFCENCGWKIGEMLEVVSSQTTPNPEAAADELDAQPSPTPPTTQPGALRNQMSMLSGAARKLKARLQSISAKFPAGQEKAASSSEKAKKKSKCSSRINLLLSIISGLGLAALFVWLLLRHLGIAMLGCLGVKVK